MNAYAYFARAFAAHRDRPFLTAEGGERYTYADLDRETARVANLLTGLGLRKGDRVAAQIDKSPRGLFLYLGALRAGLCYLPLNTAYQRGELAYYLGDAEPGVVVCGPRARESFGELLRARPGTTLYTLDESGGGSFVDALAGAATRFDPVPCAASDLAVIIYTSGTTGRAKGAMVTHGNLSSNGQALKDCWRFTERDVLLHALPLFHIHGLFVAISPVLIAGAQIAFQRKFETRAALAALPGVTAMMGVPTFYTRLLEDPDLTRESTEHMRLFVAGSAPLQAETFNAFLERTGHAILERYGMSEAGMIASNPYEGERRPGSVGVPLPGIGVRVVDGRRRCGPDEPGEVQVCGPNVFAGYWRMLDRTAEEFTADRWFRTGDIGQWSKDGYLSIVGRAKDLIISGGYNVYPKEVELVIDELPGIVESAVIGVPHPDFGEAVTAVVVRDNGVALDEAAIIAHVKARIANYKVPKRVDFLDRLPRNAMGKVQKNLLREKFK